MKLLFASGKLEVFEDPSNDIGDHKAYVWLGRKTTTSPIIETPDNTMMEIDGDGSGGNAWHDPCFQSDTTLHHNGKALNPNTVPYVVIPPELRRGLKGVVLGAKVQVAYKDKTVDAVAGDIGPSSEKQGNRYHVGESSIRTAQLLGIPHSPLTGGTDSGVTYRIWPSLPAVVDGVEYSLAPA